MDSAAHYLVAVIRRVSHPLYPLDGQRYAFGRGSAARPLRIFIDTQTCTDASSLEILEGFSHHEQVEVISSDGTTPIRVTVSPFDPANSSARVIMEFSDGRRVHSAILGPDYPRIARECAQPGEEAETERALFFAIAARENGADALATESRLLLDGPFPPGVIVGANPMLPGEAVALLGLFLRVREDFTLAMGDSWSVKWDRSMFYWVLMRELLSSGWRWFSAIVANAAGGRDDEFLLTAQSALERVERALRARDRMHERLQLPPSRDSVADALFYFDAALLMLGGAFDGLARVTDRVHGLGGRRGAVGWTKDSWAKRLAGSNNELAELMSPGKPCRDARELVAILRNTIHSQALRTVSWRSDGRPDELVVVPSDIEAELLGIVSRLGSPSGFGLERRRDGRVYIRPGTYLEVILPVVADSLNAIMDATPVERLASQR